MLEALLSGPEPGVTRELVLTGGWSTVEQSVVLLLCAIVFGLTVWNYRTTRLLRHKLGMLSLRAAILGLLLFLFYQPAFLEETVQRSRNHIAVLLDDSQSMKLALRSGTRLDAQLAFLDQLKEEVDEWEVHNDVAFYRFSDSLETIEAKGELTGEGKTTPLLETLARLSNAVGTRDLAGVILASDGVDNGVLSERMQDAVGLDNETREVLARLDAPVHTFGFSSPDAVKDVSVQEVRASSFAFHLNATSLHVTVRITGVPPGTEIAIHLFEDDQLLTTRRVRTSKNRRDHELTFDFVPRTLGPRVFSVVADPIPGEITPENNEKQVVVKVIRDRVRVLQICGHPSWDQRFLRNLLKRDPSIDLISFFILINPRNAFAVSQGDTTLIPFPAHELFVEELGGFDLVIFQDFNHGPFQTRQHLWRVRDFVRQGGAFAMIGGARTFSEGGYYGTEITEILPVQIAPTFTAGDTLDTESFQPVLTEAGRAHPVTRLVPDPVPNEALWRSLPTLEGINLSTDLRPGAVALLEHPTLRNDRGEPMPLVAVDEAGEGRVLTAMTDSTWLWAFRSSDKGGSSAAYTSFWSNAIRWLIRDPELELVRVSLDRTEFTADERVRLKATVFGLDYKPSPNHPVHIVVTRRPGRQTWEAETPFVREHSARTDAAGEAHMDVDLLGPGVFDVVATARIRERTATGRQVFLASADRPELRDVVPDVDYLRLLADATGGRASDISESPSGLTFREPELLTVVQQNELPLWSGVDVLLLACVLFGVEWWMRRRLGYL